MGSGDSPGAGHIRLGQVGDGNQWDTSTRSGQWAGGERVHFYHRFGRVPQGLLICRRSPAVFAERVAIGRPGTIQCNLPGLVDPTAITPKNRS